MAEPASLLCVNCARPPPPHRRTWNRCVRCAELNLPSTYYCGDECAQAHWPKHQAYHKAQKKIAKQIRDSDTVLQNDRSAVEAQAREAERTGDELDKRAAAAVALMAEGDLHATAKAWRKIIKEWPGGPTAYHNLALVMQRSGRFVEAAPMFLKAMELYKDGTENWADSAASAFDELMHPECHEVPKPQWWNDEALKALSARLVAVCGESHVCAMRARVLSGDARVSSKAHWSAGPRTSAEIKEAATWYRRAAMAIDTPAGKQYYEQLARACDAAADPLLAKEEVEAAAARAAAEAEAEKARAAAEAEAAEILKVAEAKASAAAEELLADEEEEKKKQAAASTTAGKAKPGKGKKGKAKR